MSDENLSIQGTLTETTVPDLIRSIVRGSETAILTLEVEAQVDTIYFIEGKISFASSTDPDMGLAETLLRMGELSMQQYETTMERITPQRRLGAMLCELGYLRPEDLTRALERQATAVVLGAMLRRTGNFTIEFTPEFPDGVVSLSIPTERLILDGVRSVEYWSLITRGVGRLERLLEQLPDADTRTFQMDLTDDESHILTLLAKPQTVREVVERSYLSNFLALRTLWGLLAVNLIQDAEQTAIDEQRATVESEYELEAFVERYNEAFQQIFSAVSRRIGDHVYDFMDRVVLHVPAPRRTLLNDITLVNEGRVDFDQLLNNLYAGAERDHAAAARELLSAMLEGWEREVRGELGDELTATVARIAATARNTTDRRSVV